MEYMSKETKKQEDLLSRRLKDISRLKDEYHISNSDIERLETIAICECGFKCGATYTKIKNGILKKYE